MTATEVPAQDSKLSGYAHPEVLVTTEWVLQHHQDANVRILESDEDILLYEQGHVPAALKLDWHTEEQDPFMRDFVDRQAFEQLMSSKGIANDTTVVVYGDKNNWYATYTFWLFKYYGHEDVRVMDGGRAKWVAEGRPMSKDMPVYPATSYQAKERNNDIRAYRRQVEAALEEGRTRLIDVRSPQEYSGELLHMTGYAQEGAQKAGHIPTAKSIPWAKSAQEDGTFKPAEQLKELFEGQEITADRDVIAYCRIGERSSHTWFVLTYLLGYPNVRNYDGSWTEWGSSVGVPIERTAETRPTV